MANPKTQDLTRKIRENEAQRRQSEAAEAARAGWRWPSPDEAERRLSGQAGALTGLALGVPRGAFDMARDGVNAANFVGRLMDPSDAYHSPAGQAAWDDVFRAGKRGFDYLTSHWADPSKIGSDFRHVSVGSNVYLHPGAAPLGPSARGEFANQLQTGMNVGEGVFGVGAFLGGAAEFRSIPELRALSKGAGASDYLPAGAPQRMVDYMAEPYSGMGSHAPIPRSVKLPWGSPYPKTIVESVFNKKLPPSGTPKGAFYRYHYAIDPNYYGGPVKKVFGGGGWSGKDLGWTKYGPAVRAWYGTPWQTKAAGLGLLTGLGWPAAQLLPDEPHP